MEVPKKAPRKKAVVMQNLCVSCGHCAIVCPFKAISVFKGMYAVVNKEACVGCRKCEKACPASVISMEVPV